MFFDTLFSNKPKEILALEKAWKIKIEEENYTYENNVLVKIKLGNKKIANISPLENLRELRELDLHSNLISDLSPLENLRELRVLHLWNNQISDIRPLENLRELGELFFAGNPISDLRPLGNLRELRRLSLAGNQISDLRPLENLRELRELYLWSNPISDLHPLENLSKIEYIDLRHNNISHLDKCWIEKDLDILYEEYGRHINSKKYINLYGNPLLSPPKEVVIEGMAAMRAWYSTRTEEEPDAPLNEMRVILLGDGKVGKTTLKKQLLGEDIPENELQTDGISIAPYWPAELPNIKIRLWDFGGQEIQHSVHKLFLQDNCVYVLLIDKRKDNQKDGTLQYWLDHIRSFGGNSPILIVENQIDTDRAITAQSTAEDIQNRVRLNPEIERYYQKSDAPLDFVGISAKYGYNMPTFKQKLFALVHRMNNKGLYPPQWIRLKTQVEEAITGGTDTMGLPNKNYITKESYDYHCQQLQIPNTNHQNTILNILLRLGVAFYFKPEHTAQKNWLILNPEWVTVGIYSLILSKEIKNLNGRLLRSDLERILVQPETNDFFTHRNDYTFNHHELGYLLGLMENYELCYTPNRQEYFLPMGFVGNYSPNFQAENPHALAFFFEYSTLPESIWFKFVVRCFKRKIVSRYWHGSVELTGQNANALVEFLPQIEKKIKIWVSGPQAQDLLYLLRYELDFVNEEFTNIQVTPKVYTENGRDISYTELLACFADNRPYKQGFLPTIDAKELLQRFENQEHTLKNVWKELQKNNDNQEAYRRDILEQLQKMEKGTTIINQIYNTNTNHNEIRLELPYEANALEGKLNVLREELQQQQRAEAAKVAEKLDVILDLLTKLRQTPTKEEAQRKGLFEQLKDGWEWIKTGKEITEVGGEILGKIDLEQVQKGIEQILQMGG